MFKTFLEYNNYFIKKPDFFLTSYTFNFFNLIKIKKISFYFFLSKLTSLEELLLINFFNYINDFFCLKKKPYIKKIFISNRAYYKLCIIYTFRKTLAFFILEIILFKIKDIPVLDFISFFQILFFQKQKTLFFYIKKITFFDSNQITPQLPQVSSLIKLEFDSIAIENKTDLIEFLDLDNKIDINFYK